MKIKKGFLLREVVGENVVIAVGEAAKSFNVMIRLNPTGAFLWKKIEQGADEKALADALLEEYDTDFETANKDAAAFVSTLREAGLLE